MVTADMAQVAYTANVAFPCFRPRSYFYPVGLSTMGYALPAAIGAKLAAPDRAAVALTGDGGFLFTAAELGTAVEWGLPIVVLLWNNDGLGQIRDRMTERNIPPIGVNPRNPDFLALARAFGCRTARPASIAGLKREIRAGLRRRVPTVIEIHDDGAWLIGRDAVKITAIETFCLRYDMPYPLTYARGEYAHARGPAGEGPDRRQFAIFGWGESAMWGGPHGVTATVIEREIAPLIIGQDPRRPEYLWEKVFQETYYHGRRGILLAALSGVDIALWDILGKCAGQPLWRLLGGFGRPVSAYASAGYYRRDYGLDAFAADVAKARAAGFRGYKMKIGNIPQAVHYGVLARCADARLSIDEDLKRVATAREAIGGDRNLMVDATTSLTPRVAMRYAEALEPLNIRWFEEPVLAEDVAGCAELARRTRIAIAGFETETGRDAFARLIDAGAIQVVQPDIVQVGGITEARKIAAYAQMRHLPFTSKNYSTIVSSAACLHLLYALPNGEYFECDQDPLPWRNEILKRAGLSPGGWHGRARRGAGPGRSDIDERSSRPGWFALTTLGAFPLPDRSAVARDFSAAAFIASSTRREHSPKLPRPHARRAPDLAAPRACHRPAAGHRAPARRGSRWASPGTRTGRCSRWRRRNAARRRG